MDEIPRSARLHFAPTVYCFSCNNLLTTLRSAVSTA